MRSLLFLVFFIFNSYSNIIGEVNEATIDQELVKDYQKSECYLEFHDVYNKNLASYQKDLELKRRIEFSTGFSLQNYPVSSDIGKSERAIANAADYKKSISSFGLNEFDFIHSFVQKKFPEISEDETQYFIRKGFVTGKFCDHWFFSTRYNRRQVGRYVRKEFESYHESKFNRSPAISNSEENKSDDDMNLELEFTNDTKKASGSKN